uniref:G-protein signaling modulator 3 n=1 Tax=Nothobranchius kadleci TaxID=1051664 RepID=A0A1A8D8K0_NOTKA
MECSATEAEVVAEELLEPLIITEDGDIAGAVPERDTTSSSAAASQNGCTDESALQQKEELLGGDEKKEAVESKTSSVERLEKQQSETEDGHKPEAGELEGTGRTNDGQNSESKEPLLKVTMSHEEPRKTQEEKVAQDDRRVEIRRFHASEQLPKEAEGQEEDAKKAHQLTPDFPEALFELLCTLQEGRRLNDQRCSFRLEEGVRRRRCHSEPNTRKPAHRVVFSSMTSLQKEEFFDLVATAQARRLDDQRAHLGKSAAPKPKCRSFRGSLKQLSVVRKPEPAPVPVPKEDLYDMILTTQAQGRLEDQRSRAPGPMDDDDFFSLLLRVQGGRMDEQRTELPRLLQT